MMNHLFKSSKAVVDWPFHKLLIANRGEIAVRIIRACRDLGIRTVAVYSTADRDALHTKLADESICIGPASAKDSYLSIDQLIEAAKVTRSDAIHPGYGFLSEDPTFAKQIVANDLIYIGADADVISLLGNKEAARKTMHLNGMPIVSGSKEAVTDEKVAAEQAEQIGYPVMLKASSGGGGKGMRIIHSRKEFAKLFSVAQGEAVESFNDEHMYIEKYLANPRHIEVQIIADQYGNVVSVGERDCTIQSHNQKVMEEAPAVILNDVDRNRMLSICENVVAPLHYVGLGTIEFLYEGPGRFYFMEMNTRIQVEHPITELTSGIDLVKAQLMVSAGAQLAKMHPNESEFALECRITALSAGTITGLHLPGGYGIRIDTAIYQGYVVPPYYDAMIAKIIVFGSNRQEVVQQMRSVIDETVVNGIDTNLNLLAQILSEPDFRNMNTNVNWLDNQIQLSNEQE
ncbi:ATP-grasp domain-containing protein [Nicoliella spurrieriana]|uniref:biotin carboxylase n=1 Tax=Nicoliella spurrieriana TaxID=2925830 RepID=A0A976RRK3_9LACO|nr:biotin carboxylase N-terminal domain-containing protein [Nicoliella spurrieriana]UQS86592.1 ATP-grasp domain-containing protein [Nicoliella spurrieriana]